MACGRAPRCGADYQAKLSGPLLDRIDLVLDVPAVRPADLALPPPRENTADVAARVAAARKLQRQRAAEFTARSTNDGERPPACNAELSGSMLEEIAAPDAEGKQLLTLAAERMRLSARGWHRVLRVARTLADLDAAPAIRRIHIAEALSWRRPASRGALAA